MPTKTTRAKRIRHKIEYAGVRLLLLLIHVLPLGFARGFGAFLGWLTFRILGIRKKVTVGNIHRALGGEVKGSEAYAVGLRSYENFGRSLVEFAAFKKLSKEKVLSMVILEGKEHLDEALRAGKGAILLTGHFDNWELLGAAVAALGYPIHFLVGEQSNKMVDDLMNELRSAQGIGIISRNIALKKVMRALADNQLIAMLPDQDAGKNGVFVDFFGKPASTFKGPATFAVKQGCPVIPGFMVRRPGGPHLGVIEKPIPPEPDMGKEEAVRYITQAFTNVLMEYIRKYPDHYFWAHRRWKTKPPES